MQVQNPVHETIDVALSASLFDRIHKQAAEEKLTLAGGLVVVEERTEKGPILNHVSPHMPVWAVKDFDSGLAYFQFMAENPGYRPIPIMSVRDVTFMQTARLKYAQWLIDHGYATKEDPSKVVN